MRHQAVLPLDTVRKTFENLAGIEIKISVYMTEFMSGETMSGFSHTRIITSDIIIRFLSKPPVVFTPGMPLNGHVCVSYFWYSYHCALFMRYSYRYLYRTMTTKKFPEKYWKNPR